MSIFTEVTPAQATLFDQFIKVADPKNDFHKSLSTQYLKYGKLSEKQWAWVQKIAKAAKAPTTHFVPGAHTALKAAQSSALKFPKVTLPVDGSDVVLNLKMAKAGYVAVKTGGSYVGSIMEGDVFKPSFNFKTHADLDAMIAAIEEFGIDPQGVAAAYGKETGTCCFCGLHLTDPKSVHAGYGPKCAQNYSLPWGEVE